jgi:flagellar basal body-associated protein FliL
MKVLLIAAGLVLAIAGGIGGTFAAMHFLHHIPGTAAARPAAASQPLQFADLEDITVSIPPDAGSPATSYVQLGLQFATHDPKILLGFATYQPIIKSAIINLLMDQTSAALQDPKIRAGLLTSCLGIANDVLAKNAGANASHAFEAVYISNLVVQD